MRHLPWFGAGAVLLCWLGYLGAQSPNYSTTSTSRLAVIDTQGRFVLDGVELKWFHDKKPLNNQCPVCGTMADAYHSEGSPVALRYEAHQNLIRCARCNAAFWQDAAERGASQ